jgi:uncharacterized protein (TIGR03084 family)
MLQQAVDFRAECDALYKVLEPLSDEDWEREGQFKDWTINEIMQHLHYWNYGADLSLNDEDAFLQLMADLGEVRQSGEDHRRFVERRLNGAKGAELLVLWRNYYNTLADHFQDQDPKKRVKWAGPDMSVRSSMTARLMETWSHAQAIYDVLGLDREDKDRIKNIAVIGINTFGWTFANRGMDVPGPMPYVRLTAPSGDIWEWGDDLGAERIQGAAVAFCQVVTQVRNIADTDLDVTGPIATNWMAMAQCFAGAPEDPPKPGTRFVQEKAV